MQSTPYFNLKKAAYPVRELPDGIIVDAPVSGGRLVGRKRPDGTYRRQCGEYVNDVIGIPSFIGDTLTSKKNRIVPKAPLAPGSVGVMDTRTNWGHVFICERVLPAQRYVISESNPLDTETWRRIECSLADLHKRGFIGCTPGLDMTPPLPPVASEAKAAWNRAKAKGLVSDKTNPEEEVNSETLQWVFANRGVMQAPTGSEKQIQWYILALDRTNWFEDAPTNA